MSQSKQLDFDNGNIRAYQNVMETLVHQEIHRQMKAMPEKLLKYIDASEVATFALNRLPPLYASSEQGKLRQTAKGENKLKKDVATAVRQALAAVQRDPLRNSTPLPSEKDASSKEAEAALRDLEKLLRSSYVIKAEDPELTWDNLQLSIAKALKRTAEKGIVDRHIEQLLTENDYDHYRAPIYDWTDQQYQT
ncbi:MAG: late competence development ComFB family protein [Limnothrix sp. RL_2_0]|nr:late competence development ComFB family protein [Limnothrix sp. RL_2_0]